MTTTDPLSMEGAMRRPTARKQAFLRLVVVGMMACWGTEAVAQTLAGTVWTIRNSIDDIGLTWDGSTLVFTSQQPTGMGVRLVGYFDWSSSADPLFGDYVYYYGRELFVGTLIGTPADGVIQLVGQSIDRTRPSFLIVTATYTARLVNGTLVNGRWGGAGAASGSWEAQLASTQVVAPVLTGGAAGLLLSLSWTPGSALSYWLEAGSSSGLSNVFSGDVGPVTALSATVAAGSYYIRVRPRTSTGLGPVSNEVAVTIGGGCNVSSPPTGVSSSVSGSTVSVRWNSPPGATAFVLEAGLSTGASNALVANVGAATMLTGTATPGTYYVRVRAISACGVSAPSSEIVIVVP